MEMLTLFPGILITVAAYLLWFIVRPLGIYINELVKIFLRELRKIVDFLYRSVIVGGLFLSSVFSAYMIFDEEFYIYLFNIKIPSDLILINASVATIGLGILGSIVFDYYLARPLGTEISMTFEDIGDVDNTGGSISHFGSTNTNNKEDKENRKSNKEGV